MDTSDILDLTNTEQTSDYDYSIEKKDIVSYISPTNTTWGGLNSSAVVFDFQLTAGSFVDLSSPQTGFLCKFIMRGDAVAAGTGGVDVNRNGTMSSNWFNYLFQGARLIINGQEVEYLTNLGVLTDIEYIMRQANNSKELELAGYIPDGPDSGESEDSFTTVIDALVPATPTNLNIIAAMKALTPNPSYNKGYNKRLQTYGRLTAANQTIYAYVPLSHIFKFCQKATTLLSYLQIKVEFTPKIDTDKQVCYFGDYLTSAVLTPKLNFSSTNMSGISDMKLAVQGFQLAPSLQLEYEKKIASKVNIDFDIRYLEEIESTTTYTTRTITCGSRPRFIFVIPKRGVNYNNPAYNAQLCPNADIESVQINFGTTGVYPRFLQQGEFAANKYLEFYSAFSDVARVIGGCPLDMSINDFKKLNSIFAFDVRAQPKATLPTWTFSVNITRKTVPAAETALGTTPTETNPRTVKFYIIVYQERRAMIQQKIALVEMINPNV